MVIGRRIARRKGQHVVALPPEVRDRLEVIPGQWLYFHLGRKGEVVISPNVVRPGGQPPTASLEEALARERAKNARLTAQLAEVAPAARNRAWHELAAKKFSLQMKGLPVLDSINERLRRLEDQLGVRRGPWSYRVTRARPRKVETVAAPVLDSTPLTAREETDERQVAAPLMLPAASMELAHSEV